MPLSKKKDRERKRKAFQPNSNLTDTYKAPMPEWMKPGAKVKPVRPTRPAWLQNEGVK